MTKLPRISGPADDYRGPASGIGTEHGDSWRVAVGKMNAVIDAINGESKPLSDANVAQTEEDRFAALEAKNAALEEKIAAMQPIVDMVRDFFNDEPDAQEPPPAIGGGIDRSGDQPWRADAEIDIDAHGHTINGGQASTSGAPVRPSLMMGGSGVDPATNEPVPANALRDNPAVLGSLAGAASGEGQIIGDAHMPDEVIIEGQPENRDELIQTADGEYHPITPTEDTSGVELTGAEGRSNPTPQPQGQGVDDPIDPEPIATFDGKPGIVMGGTRDEQNSNNRFVASGASGQVVGEKSSDKLEQKPGQQGDPRPDGEPLSPLAVLADREQELQAKDEVTAANTLKPDVDPEQAVDNPATPPSGETLNRADAAAANNQRTTPNG